MDTYSFLSYLASLSSLLTALLVLYRDPHSFVHRTFAGGMAILSVQAMLTGWGFYDISYVEVTPWQLYQLIPYALSLGVWLAFSLTFARANYREFLVQWKWVILASFALPLVPVIFFWDQVYVGGPIFGETSMSLFVRVGWAGYALRLFYLIGAVLILMNLERTLRYSIGHSRWQVKFMVVGVGSIFGARIYTDSQVVLFSMLEISMESINMGALLIANILIAHSLRRARLLKFDFHLSHSVLYGSVTVFLVGVYFIAVGVVARTVFYLRGTHDPALTTFFVFVAILGLAVLLLSDRLRLQRKRFISRHFQKPRYDYLKVWAQFTERTASLASIRNLCNNIVGMVSETLETLSVSIWLVDEQEETLSLGGSTAFLAADREENLKITGKTAKTLIRTMEHQTQPVNVKKSSDSWAEDLGAILGETLKEARIDLCVPVSAAGQLVGILTVGEKVADEAYPFEDLELLKTVADQAAANLLTLRLGERLQQAKEMEAFQVMSAFFMHDLKNLASRLSLVTQNLPIHFDNPEFRNDALKTISQSLDKINGMCSRLSLLSQKLELHFQEVDLNELLKITLKGLDGLLKAKPILELQPLPKTLLDPEQIQKVLTNLILNANEAIRSEGGIKIATNLQENLLILSISDDGCGMAKEFMETRLFRPFQTTKRQGMGIGLFHSKKIIEAHQGRIEVESEGGKGSTFKLFMPMKQRR
jgi:putative PEP-CTERM system histidine kinase